MRMEDVTGIERERHNKKRSRISFRRKHDSDNSHMHHGNCPGRAMPHRKNVIHSHSILFASICDALYDSQNYLPMDEDEKRQGGEQAWIYMRHDLYYCNTSDVDNNTFVQVKGSILLRGGSEHNNYLRRGSCCFIGNCCQRQGGVLFFNTVSLFVVSI